MPDALRIRAHGVVIRLRAVADCGRQGGARRRQQGCAIGFTAQILAIAVIEGTALLFEVCDTGSQIDAVVEEAAGPLQFVGLLLARCATPGTVATGECAVGERATVVV